MVWRSLFDVIEDGDDIDGIEVGGFEFEICIGVLILIFFRGGEQL